MVLAQAHVLVQVDGLDLGEVQDACLVLGDQFLVGTDGAGAGGQTQDTVGLQGDDGSDDGSGLAADVCVILGADNIDHNWFPLSENPSLFVLLYPV